MKKPFIPIQLLASLPKTWIIPVLVLWALYVFVLPQFTSKIGKSLPSLGSVLKDDLSKPYLGGDKSKKSKDSDAEVVADSSIRPIELNNPVDDTSAYAVDELAPPSNAKSKADAEKPLPPPPDDEADEPDDPTLLHGVLKETSRKESYVSPAGLQYNPGSSEGHRLKHLERHLSDQPDRPGKHGVFEGGWKKTLKTIDAAYQRAVNGEPGTKSRTEDRRTIYDVTFSEPIGYIGGQTGNQQRKPPAKHLRLVVEGKRFITAFPY